MLTKKNDNVSELKDYGLYEDILSFLEEYDQKSNDKRQNRNNKTEKSSTRLSYEKNIREFFKEVAKKDIEHLTEQDLKLKKREIINYRKYLQEQKGNSNSTVNQKLGSIKSLFQFLNGEHEVNVSIFELKRLDSIPNSYGKITKDEAELFAETVFTNEREKQFLKKILILTAIRTSFRLDELLNLRWESFEQETEISYKVSVQGKRGKLVSNGISSKLYNEIIKLKETNKEAKWSGDSNIVFQISETAINGMMSRTRKTLEIEPSRNLVFHSFRNVGINWEYESTLDIKKAAQQANHSNIDTTYKSYIEHKRDYSQAAGVRMDEEIDLSFLEDLTIEDFKAFILNGNVKTQLDVLDYAKNNKLLAVGYISKQK